MHSTCSYLKKNNIQNEIYIHNDSFNVLKLKEEYTRSKTDEIGEKIFHIAFQLFEFRNLFMVFCSNLLDLVRKFRVQT